MDLATTPARRGMEDPGLARRLWQVVLAVCHMLRRGLSPKRIMMDVHLLLGRGKLVGRALRRGHHLPSSTSTHRHRRRLTTTSYGGGASASSSSTTLASFYGHPREVEFSCTTTPSSFPQHYYGGLFPFSKGRRSSRGEAYGGLDAAAVARAFEMLSAEVDAGTPAAGGVLASTPTAATATPSPMVAWILGRSPAGVRPLRVTDSPFPAVPEDGDDVRVDADADDFIRKFYEQLRLQPTAATPDAYHYHLRRRG